jgi:hypothetical protein
VTPLALGKQYANTTNTRAVNRRSLAVPVGVANTATPFYFKDALFCTVRIFVGDAQELKKSAGMYAFNT